MIFPASRVAPLFPLLLGLALSACNDDKGSNPLSAPEAFLSAFKPGDSRLLLREFKAQGRIYGFDFYTLAEIHIDKDTVIEGAPAKAFTVTASEFFPESTYVRAERNFLVARGDSLNIYRDKEGNAGLFFGLLKRGAYDTTRFSDKTTEWIFPLVAGSSWPIRPKGGESWDIEKEWMGKENLEFEGREYACDVFAAHSIVELKSWVSRIGLLKAEIEYGPYIFTDTAGNEVDTAQTMLDRYDLLKLNPTAAETAAAKVKYKSFSTEKTP
jgi:hypothetical protein